jgi:hypothetical protein
MKIALLDSSFVFKGLEDVDVPEEMSQHRIPVPNDCDLKPGHYLWSHEKGRFVPISDPLEKEKVKREVDVVKVVYRFMDAVVNGKPMPKIVTDWMADYRVSMDNKD